MNNGFIDPKERHTMAKEDPEFEFLVPASFEWDDQKRELNLAKHDIDFDGATEFSIDLSFFADRIATMRSAGPP